MMKRIFAAAISVSSAISLSGCAELPVSPMPSFANPFFIPTRLIPVSLIEKQVQCEVRQFLNEMDQVYENNPTTNLDIGKDYLQNDGAAIIVLNLQTDQSGKATLTSIDTSKLGLDVVTSFITLSNKIPSLQANLQAKGTVSSQVTFVIPQTKYDIIDFNMLRDNVVGKPEAPKPGDVQDIPGLAKLIGSKASTKAIRLLPITYGEGTALAVVDQSDKDYIRSEKSKIPGIDYNYKSQYALLTYKNSVVYDDNALISGGKPKDGGKDKTNTRIIKGLASLNCDGVYEYNPMQRFFIANWLTDYFNTKIRADANQLGLQSDATFDLYADTPLIARIGKDSNMRSVACMKELQLKTQIALTFDMSSGISPIFGPMYILPVSGVSLDYNPANTEFLQITFALQNRENQELCNKLLPRTPISGNKV